MSAVFDIAVVGAGVTGLTAAALAARDGARVVVIAPHFEPTPAHGATDLRTFAITPASARILRAAGAWALLDTTRIGAFDAMTVWDAGSRGHIEFMPPPLHDGPMGWIIERSNLVAALAGALAALAVPIRRVAVEGLASLDPAGLALGDGTRLDARLVIAADGMDSLLRGAAGIDWQHVGYAQRALVANVLTALPHQRRARQRFLSSGPLAFLPLAEACAASIVWSCTDQRAAALESMDDDRFMSELAIASEHALGNIVAVSPRASFALGQAHASRLVAGKVVLVGDAAHVVHPLAGQGLNLGLLDVAALVECVGAAGGPRWPRRSALRRYERWRHSEAQALRLATDGLNRLFLREEAPLRWLRGAGLRLTNACRPLKHWFSDQAMGNSGDLPRIARAAAR